MTDWDTPYGELIDTRVRVLTWNLWWRFGPWRERQALIVDTLRAVEPDVIALQEVWDDGTDNQAGMIAEALGYHYVYEARLDNPGVRFGNAVVSRWPITGTEARPLPAPERSDELRSMMRADIDGPRGEIQLFTPHLNWRFDESAIRQEQVRALADFVAGSPPRHYPAVVCGDFNAEPDSDEIRMLVGKSTTPAERLVFHDAWVVAGDGTPGYTWSNANPYVALALEPNRRIDYVFAGWPKAGGAGHVVDCRLVGTESRDGVWPSDHFGVVADLRY